MPVRIRLNWDDPNPAETGHRIYRAEAPMDPMNLPTPLATLGPNVTEYLDESVVQGLTYYYRVGAYSETGEGVSGEVSEKAEVTTVDPYWTSVVSLLHMDGADGSTTFTDETGLAWTVSGNSQIDTGQSKFGGASGEFDGSGDRIQATHANLILGTGDFTIEFFVRPSSSGWGTRYLMSTGYVAGAWFTLGYDYSAGKFVEVGDTPTLSGTHAKDTWHHIAITRSDGMIRVFVNGIKSGEEPNTKDYTQDTYYFGGTDSNIAGSGGWLVGHMDELRITKGVARYVADFTPPNSAFLAG